MYLLPSDTRLLGGTSCTRLYFLVVYGEVYIEGLIVSFVVQGNQIIELARAVL